MDRTAILASIQEIVRETLDDDDVVLTETTKASDVSGWDSMNQLRIVMAVEKKYGVQFEVEEIESLADVGALVGLVERYAR
ncbi:hypothetical protein BH09PSE2_BH09PSE2_02170 [soil metagenome]